MLIIVFYILFCYFLGSILGGYIIAKIFSKKDFAENDLPGGAGTARQIGLWAGILAVFFDAFKGIVVVVIGKYLGLDLIIIVFGALAAVIGHNWPVFFKFKGGVGLATIMGASICLLPKELAFAFPMAVLGGYAYRLIYKRLLLLKILKKDTSPNPVGGLIGILSLLILSIYFKEAEELILLILGAAVLSLLKMIEWKLVVYLKSKKEVKSPQI
jgi:acyl-phosphate glycerol 3-phosphate acyltransferase